jgi:hypothetical protein
VFFQSMLLAGYAYAHLLTRYVPGRISILVHLAVMALAASTLPLALGTGRPPAGGETFWLLGLFATSIGLPFFALAANGPLLQAWFARTDHPDAGDPYFLYAASNVGSFLALLSYPTLVEPLIPLSTQTRLWSVFFYILIALIVAGGTLSWRAPGKAAAPATADRNAAAPSWRDGLIWCALGAVPAGLLIAVTAHISTDVAAVPLLWVLPRLGGSPSVWSVAMVFFQTMLLAGYAYAHVLTRYAPGRLSILIHLAVMGLAAFGLPLAIGSGRPPADGEIFWLLGLFTTSIGLPFFALAANGPLLQAWFARTDHADAKDPFFLYAASNVGSFLALLSYPTMVEPLISLSAQTRLWSIGFYVLIVLIIASSALLRRVPAGVPRAATV